MTTLVTGGTGFLGRSLTRALVSRGDRVRALVRRTSDRSDIQRWQTGMSALPVEFVTGDVTDRASLDAAMKGCDRVFHAAALVATWRRDRSEFDRVNVDGTRNVLNAALAAGVRRIICTSTFLVLKPGESPMREDSREKIGPGPLTSSGVLDLFSLSRTDYARTKRLAQEIIDAFVAKGAPVVTVYPGILFGPGPATAGNLISGWIARFLDGRFPGYLGRGDRLWSFSFVEDVARGHLLADEKGRPGRGYCLGGENATIRRFMEIVAELAHRQAPTRCVPYSVAGLAGWLQECRAAVTGKEPELTRAVVDTFRHHWPLDSSSAQTELGYTITPLVDAIHQTLEWTQGEKLADGT